MSYDNRGNVQIKTTMISHMTGFVSETKHGEGHTFFLTGFLTFSISSFFLSLLLFCYFRVCFSFFVLCFSFLFAFFLFLCFPDRDKDDGNEQ